MNRKPAERKERTSSLVRIAGVFVCVIAQYTRRGPTGQAVTRLKKTKGRLPDPRSRRRPDLGDFGNLEVKPQRQLDLTIGADADLIGHCGGQSTEVSTRRRGRECLPR